MTNKHHSGCSTLEPKCYDVVIVGAGPAGLATLSALQESFTVDHMTETQRNHIQRGKAASYGRPSNIRIKKGSKVTASGQKKKSVCVIDPSGGWMTTWNENFSKLDIQFLRSPTLAHPDAFDEHALLAFAVSQGREDELLSSGCSDVNRFRGLDNAYNGLWKMPSTQLFRDFCQHTANNLPHDFVADSVTDIQSHQNHGKQPQYVIRLQNKSEYIQTHAIVLAMGATGSMNIPKGLQSNVPDSRLRHWTQLTNNSVDDPQTNIPSEWKEILVVGGGLTAVQVAQLALKQTTRATSGDSSTIERKVTLCSRRPLIEKHLDVGLEWFDIRKAQKCQSDFYYQSIEERLDILKTARNGGSVPPWYMRQKEQFEAKGELKCVVGNPICIYSEEIAFGEIQANQPSINSRDNSGKNENCFCCPRNSPLIVSIGPKIHRFDGIIIACGVSPDCTQNQVFSNLIQSTNCAENDGIGSYEKETMKHFCGLPVVSEDLEWFLPNVFVVGAMAGLNLGPDAGNLMGMRRAATLVSNALGCRAWLRDPGNVWSNRYALFHSDSDSDGSETGSESDSEDD